MEFPAAEPPGDDSHSDRRVTGARFHGRMRLEMAGLAGGLDTGRGLVGRATCEKAL